MSRLAIIVEDFERKALEQLARGVGEQSAADAVACVVRKVIDGVAQPGSAEHAVVLAWFGYDAVDKAAFELRDEG